MYMLWLLRFMVWSGDPAHSTRVESSISSRTLHCMWVEVSTVVHADKPVWYSSTESRYHNQVYAIGRKVLQVCMCSRFKIGVPNFMLYEGGGVMVQRFVFLSWHSHIFSSPTLSVPANCVWSVSDCVYMYVLSTLSVPANCVWSVHLQLWALSDPAMGASQ